jgi:hypothetical protein
MREPARQPKRLPPLLRKEWSFSSPLTSNFRVSPLVSHLSFHTCSVPLSQLVPLVSQACSGTRKSLKRGHLALVLRSAPRFFDNFLNLCRFVARSGQFLAVFMQFLIQIAHKLYSPNVLLGSVCIIRSQAFWPQMDADDADRYGSSFLSFMSFLLFVV